jgi:uncharacterized iron-regulated membrane protein
MALRSLIFWPHLISGLAAGGVIFIMSVTGVLLTYEKQMVAWADRNTTVLEPPGAARMTPEALIARVTEDHGAQPAAIARAAAPGSPALVTIRQTVWLVDPYSGATIAPSAPRLRKFFRGVTDWHRWLAVQGEGRASARAITGWANILFLLMVLSGVFLWWPRRWTLRHVKAVTIVNTKLSGKARDFNWHNSIGFWCAIPLFFVVISATPISFSWASALVYRLAGDTPPAAAAPRGVPATPAALGRPGSNAAVAQVDLAGLNAAWQQAEQQVSGWRTVTLRLPANGRAPFVFTIDRAGAGQPQYRGTLTIARGAAAAPRWEPFEAQSSGRRLRSVLRFLHTGEVLGVAGQTVAGLASLGGAFLVWTGFALSYRRFFKRARSNSDRESIAA